MAVSSCVYGHYLWNCVRAVLRLRCHRMSTRRGFPARVSHNTTSRTVQEFAVAVEWNVDFFTLAVCAANAAAAGVVVLCWDAPMKAQAAPALELSNCSLCCSTWRGKHG